MKPAWRDAISRRVRSFVGKRSECARTSSSHSGDETIHRLKIVPRVAISTESLAPAARAKSTRTSRQSSGTAAAS
jgi:hypothetical protein